MSTRGTEEILFLLRIDEELGEVCAMDPTVFSRRLTSYIEGIFPDGGRSPLTTIRIVRKGELRLRRTIHIFEAMAFLEDYLIDL